MSSPQRCSRILSLVLVGASIFLATPNLAHAAPPTSVDRTMQVRDLGAQIGRHQTSQMVPMKMATAGSTRVATDWGSASRCATAIALLAAGFYLSGYKWYRVVQAVRAVGGIIYVVRAVLSKGTAVERVAEFQRIFGSLALDVLGITAIRENCIG